MKFTKSSDAEKIVIVLKQGYMSEDQITSALRVSEQTMWWRALIQLIATLRSEYPPSAAGCAGMNNALGMARDMGAYEALTQLLANLEIRRSSEG